MQNFEVKADGVGKKLTASEFNNYIDELENLVTNSGQVLSGADTNQMGKGVANYAGAGDFFTDSGTANAYVLSAGGLRQAPTEYIDGMRVRFIPTNSNSALSTVNLNGLGIKNIIGTVGGEIINGELVKLVYSASNNGFFIDNKKILLASQYLGNAGYPIFNKENASYPATTDIGFGTNKHLWLFDNNASGNISDEFGVRTLTLGGDALKQSRNFKNDTDVFNSLDGATYFENSSVDTGTGSFVFGVMIDFNSITPSADNYIGGRIRTDNNIYRSWYFDYSIDGLIFRLYYDNAGNSITLQLAGVNKLSGKHFVEAFYNQAQTKIQIYIDGVLVGESVSASLSARNNNASSRFVIGAISTGASTQTNFYQGIIDIAYYADAIPTEAQHQALVAKILGYTYDSGNDKINEMGKDFCRILTDTDLDVVANYSLGHRAYGWIMDSITADAVASSYAGTLIKNTGNTGVALKVRGASLKQSRHLDGTLKYNFFNGSQALEITNSESADIISTTPKSFIAGINLRTLNKGTTSDQFFCITNEGAIANYGFVVNFFGANYGQLICWYDNAGNYERLNFGTNVDLPLVKGKDCWVFFGHSLEDKIMFVKFDNQSPLTKKSSNLKTRNCTTSQKLTINSRYNGSTYDCGVQAQTKQAFLAFRPFRFRDIVPICDFIMSGKISHSFGQVDNFGNLFAKITDKEGNVTKENLEKSIITKISSDSIYYNFNGVLTNSKKINIGVE